MNILWIFGRLLLGFFCTCKFYNELMNLTKDNRITLPMIGNLDTHIKLQRMMWVQHNTSRELSMCGHKDKTWCHNICAFMDMNKLQQLQTELYGRKDFCSQPHVVQINALISRKIYVSASTMVGVRVKKNQKKEPWNVLRRNLTCIYF